MALTIPPVTLSFKEEGASKAAKAVKTFADLFGVLENNATKASAAVAKAEQAMAKSAEQAAKVQVQASATVVKAADREATGVAKAANKAADAKVKAAEKANKAQEKINASIVKTANKALDEEAKAAKKAADAKIKEAERAAKGVASASAKAGQKAEREATQRAAKADRSRASLRGDIAGRIGGSVSGVLGAGAKLAGGVMALGGGLSAFDAVQSTMSTETAAVNFSNASVKNGSRQTSVKVAQDKFNELAKEYGVSASDVGKASSTLLAKTGSPEQALGEIGHVMKIAKATGSNVGDLAKTWGAIQSQNKDSSFEERNAILRTMIGQGNEGAIELKDQGESGVKVMARAGMFGGDKIGNIASLGAVMQYSEKTSGSAEEAATSTNSFFSDISKKEKDLKAMGVSVYDKSGNMKSVDDVIADVMGATGGSGKKMDSVFSERGIKTAAAFNEIGKSAADKAKASGASAKDQKVAYKEAIKAALADMKGKQISQGQIDDNASKVMQTQQARINIAMESFKIALGDKLVPELEKMIPKFVELAPALLRFTDGMISLANWVADNPLTAAFTGLAALVTKAVGEAFAASVIQRIVEQGFTGSGSVAGPIVAAAIVALMAAASIKAGIVSGTKEESKNADAAEKASNRNKELAAKKLKDGSLSTIEQQEFDENQLALDQYNTQGKTGGFWRGAGAGANESFWGKVLNGKTKDIGIGDLPSAIPQFALGQSLVAGASGAVTYAARSGKVQQTTSEAKAMSDKAKDSDAQGFASNASLLSVDGKEVSSSMDNATTTIVTLTTTLETTNRLMSNPPASTGSSPPNE